MRPPNTVQSDDPGFWILEEDYPVYLYFGWTNIVRKLFKTDYASTPWWSWLWLGPPSDYSGPALWHDWACRQCKNYLERMLADATFLFLLERWQTARFTKHRHVIFSVLRIPLWIEHWFDRTVMFLALRIHAWTGQWKYDVTDEAIESPQRKKRQSRYRKTMRSV